METPLISIAIPFHNDEKYLANSIQSVINQRYKNWELLLIDDGSKDSSLSIAKGFENNRIKVISDGRNLGLASRLNESIRLAKGAFYARMDADDIMDSERIEKQVEYLLRHPNVDVVGTLAYVIDTENNVIGSFKSGILHPRSIEDILNGGIFIHPTIMGRKDWFVNNPYDVTLKRMQDKGLWLKTIESSNFEIIPEKLLYYRAGGMPTMKKNKEELKCLKGLFFNIIGKKHGKWFLAIKSYIIALIKLLAYFLLDTINKTDYLVKRRYDKIDAEEVTFLSLKLKEAIKSN